MCGSLDITEPQSSAVSAYSTYKSYCKDLVGSLLGGTDLNYVVHRACVCRTSTSLVSTRGIYIHFTGATMTPSATPDQSATQEPAMVLSPTGARAKGDISGME